MVAVELSAARVNDVGTGRVAPVDEKTFILSEPKAKSVILSGALMVDSPWLKPNMSDPELPVRLSAAPLPLIYSFSDVPVRASTPEAPRMSSLMMVPLAVLVVIVAPDALLKDTLNVSFGSAVKSGLTFTEIVLLVSPAANETVPVGRALPWKSDALAGKVPVPVTAQVAELDPVVLPERVTANVKGVAVPTIPSALLALIGVIARDVPSSLRMVPVAEGVVMVAPTGLESVTAKVSLDSTVRSALTLTVMVLEVSPAAKEMVPEGKMPPWKSAAVAGMVPVPATLQAAELVPVVLPLRVTVKV